MLSLLPFTARAAVFDAESFTLGNGLRVVVVENDRAPVVTQMLMYKAGSIDEMPGRSGVAHMLEHMMFKGTEEVGPGEFSAMVSRNGGQDNAFTSYDYTGYYQSVASDRLALIMRLEADRMRNLALDDAQFQPERQVVIEERNQRVENEPSAILNEEAAPALYYNHPYSQPIIGWRHELEAMKLADLRHFYQRFYAPNNAVLVIVGDTTVEEVRDLAETYYGPIEPSEIGRTAPLMEPPHDSAHVVTLRDERVRQPSWSMRKLAPSYGTDGPTDQVYALTGADGYRRRRQQRAALSRACGRAGRRRRCGRLVFRNRSRARHRRPLRATGRGPVDRRGGTRGARRHRRRESRTASPRTRCAAP